MRRISGFEAWCTLRRWFGWAVLAAAAALVLTSLPAFAQDEQLPPEELLSAVELEELVGPIALYPDDLIALVLPAATYPLQIVQAARFLEARETDSSLQPDENWDDSVVALLNYPEVIELLNDDLDWTWELGEAVLAQRADVLDAIQDFRDRAYAAGNLRSDDRQVVTQESGAIAIKPADPEVIYVPYYEPKRVIVRQVVPVYHYYPWSYPVYYYPYPVGYSFYGFRTGFFFGVTTAFSIGWHSHHVHVHHHHHRGHPYFGRVYYDPWYVRRGLNININVVRNNIWRPRYDHGARPYRGVTRVDGVRVTRSTEGRAPRTVSRTYEGRAQRGSSNRTFGGVARSGSRSTAPRATAPRAQSRVAPNGATAAARQRAADAGVPRTLGGVARSTTRTYRSGAADASRQSPRSAGITRSRPSSSYRVQPRATRSAPQRSTPSYRSVPRAAAPRGSSAAPAARQASPRVQSFAPRQSGGVSSYRAAPRAQGAPRSGSSFGGVAAPRQSGGARAASGGGSYRSGSASRSRGGQRQR